MKERVIGKSGGGRTRLYTGRASDGKLRASDAIPVLEVRAVTRPAKPDNVIHRNISNSWQGLMTTTRVPIKLHTHNPPSFVSSTTNSLMRIRTTHRNILFVESHRDYDPRYISPR